MEFAECVWYLKVGTEGIDKLETRWESGIWLGIKDESGEVIIGTKEGAIKVRTIRRKGTKAERWNKEEFNAMKGTPWEPVPGGEGRSNKK